MAISVGGTCIKLTGRLSFEKSLEEQRGAYKMRDKHQGKQKKVSNLCERKLKCVPVNYRVSEWVSE